MSVAPGILACVALLVGGREAPPAPADWEAVTRAAEALRVRDRRGEKAVLDALEDRAREVLRRLEHPIGADAWRAAVPGLRRRLAASLGLSRLPTPRPERLRRVGTLDQGAYVVEKLVYETLPGTDVPAHLYRPARAGGKLPAILFVPGHWWADSKARPDFQAFCINMARMGFVVLTYDPFGQGERGISWRDHRRTETLLVGVAQQAIVDFESLCALEVLLSRPEVDPRRVGMTGASGGGYNTWILAAIDPRIAVSVPVVGTSEFHEQIHVCRPLDWYSAKEHCHFVPDLLTFANNHELAAMIAPRPILVISAHGDQSFPIPGIRQVVDYGRKLYSSLGEPERFGYFEDSTSGHGYQKKKREAAYGWFLRWLGNRGDGRPIPEPPTETAPWDAEKLRCFPPGQNRPAGPGINALVQRIVDALPPPSAPPTTRDLERRVVDALGIPLPTARLLSGPKLERGEARSAGGLRVERVVWRRRDGVEVPAVLLGPPAPWRGALLAASDGGKESLLGHPAVRAAVDSGLAVLLADPRGLGELAITRQGWAFAVSLLLGENLVGRQALDLVTGWRGLLALPELEGKPIGLLGSGPFASLAALYAAVLEPRAAWLIAEKGFVTYRSFVDREASLRRSYRLAAPGEERTVKIDREIPHSLVVFDVLRRFDLPDLLASLAPRPVLVTDAIDGDWETLSAERAREIFRQGRFVWPSSTTPRYRVGQEAPRAAREFIQSVSPANAPAAAPERPATNVSSPLERGKMPNRVHAVEDYETDIEKRWWMAGVLETENVPPGSRRAARGTLANDFDGEMGDPSRVHTAVIFNPVPGPPMGQHTRLGFRYWIRGADHLRVQIYSLSRGYHRHLTLLDLPQDVWRSATVDMTAARRPDGSGGPLAEDERIDDIQFYTDSAAELIIDDIVLFDAAPPDETEPFPRRPIFCGWFDTGRHGREWPGDFEIVRHEAPRTWKAARSLLNRDIDLPWIRVHLRGERPLGERTRLSFRYRLRGADSMRVSLVQPLTARETRVARTSLEVDAIEGTWGRKTLDFAAAPGTAEEIHFVLSRGAELLLDDVLLYEPGE